MISFKKEYRILVIEDNEGDFVLIEALLFEQSYEPIITQARTFEEAEQLLTNPEKFFDIILLDLTLPDKGGVPLIKEIVRLSPSIPVIVLTGYSDFTYGARSLFLGVSDYILKSEINASQLNKSIIYSIERKLAALAFEEAEKRYSDLFQLSPSPMWVFDVETLRFLDVNLAAIEKYGYTHDEFLAMTIRDIRPPDEMDKLEEVLKGDHASSQVKQPGSFNHVKKNGEIFRVDIKTNITHYKGRDAKIVLANDITDSLDYITDIENQNINLTDIKVSAQNILKLISVLKSPEADQAQKDKALTKLFTAAEALEKKADPDGFQSAD